MKKIKFFAAIMTTALFVVFFCSCTGKTETQSTTSSDIEMETIWSKAELFEIPPEEQTTESRNGENAMLAKIEEARKVYSLFGTSKPSLDKNDTKDGADGIIYYRVTDKNLDTAEKFKNYLLKYFSKEIVGSLLNVQMYIEDENGNMYAVDVGMASDNVVDYSVLSYEESDSRQKMTLSVNRDFNGDGEIDSTENLTFIREPAGTDGNWVFTQFSAF